MVNKYSCYTLVFPARFSAATSGENGALKCPTGLSRSRIFISGRYSRLTFNIVKVMNVTVENKS